MMKNSSQDALQQINRLVQAGYDQFGPGGWHAEELAAACDQWLAAWELVKQLTTPQIRSPEDFDAAYPTLELSLGNWLSDLEMHLHNAGLKEPRYFEERIRFAREHLVHFPDVDDDTYVNLRRAEGEALWLLDRQTEAEAVYQALVEKLPDHAWGYIGWADQYNWGANRPTDYERAEHLLNQALARPKLDDRKSVIERLIDLYTDWERLEEIPRLRVELIKLMEAEKKRLQQETEILRKFIQSQQNGPSHQDGQRKKLGRNDPCWCGSGKKYKKCHWKSDQS